MEFPNKFIIAPTETDDNAGVSSSDQHTIRSILSLQKIQIYTQIQSQESKGI